MTKRSSAESEFRHADPGDAGTPTLKLYTHTLKFAPQVQKFSKPTLARLIQTPPPLAFSEGGRDRGWVPVARSWLRERSPRAAMRAADL